MKFKKVYFYPVRFLEGMGPLCPPKTQKRGRCCSLRLYTHSTSMEQAQRVSTLLLSQSLAFHRVSAKLVRT